MIDIQDRYEQERGCGFRKPGGKYLVGGGPAAPCGKLPLPLGLCPTCRHGIKFARGWTWLDPRPLLDPLTCDAGEAHCLTCPMRRPPEKVGLLWVGEKFYATPEVFIEEAQRLGISRRIASVPRDLKVGQTWVWLAHRKVPLAGGEGPGVFRVFRPTAIEYVVSPTDTPSRLEELTKRGLTLVRVHPVQPNLAEVPHA